MNDFNASRFKLPETVPRDTRIRVLDRRYYSRNTSLDDGVSAGRGNTLERVRLQRTIKISTSCRFSGFSECDWLGMLAGTKFSRSHANNLTVSHNNSTYGRTWSNATHRMFSEVEGTV
jgi:hypothetical protein